MTPDAFAALPLEEQLAHLSQNFDEAPAGELLNLAASIRDWAPLAWLCAELLGSGWLASGEHRMVFAKFLLDQPETAVHRVVRAMLERVETSPEAGEALCEALLEMLRVVPVARISSMCLIDRSLKHNFSKARDAHVADIIVRTREALLGGDVGALSGDMLAQLSGRAVPELREIARNHSTACLEAFDQARAAMAKEVIETLGNAPKAISQSNAEELLSTRVYTDPGHFLIELLQNAEDAGAKHWRVIFDVDRIIVWHDGNPFDARDLVGVTSIGQTTKRKDQIGFFGVGFKSIYEVTARPRIYSDAFQFEIADVSMPKLLRDRPEDLPTEGTVLILPLKNPDDPARTPARLHAMARALDPCVLFTLRGVDLLTIELTERVEGGPQRWEAIEELPDENGISSIEQRPMNQKHRYIIQDDTYTYTRGKRAAGRADSTLIMVGLSLDEHDVPTPAPADSATVYSYLPTEEHSGLRFFVQGHFDVPVDRERVNPESDWNQWIVSNVPAQIRRALEQLVSRESTPKHMGRGILSVLPLASEIKSEVFEPLPARLTQELARVPILPARDGKLRMASELRIASEQICELFEADASFPRSALSKFGSIGQDAPFWLLDETLDEREREVAKQLGARALDFDDFVRLIAYALADDATEDRPLAAARAGDIELIARIHDLLLDGFEELDRSKKSLQALSLKKTLRKIALFPDEKGKLHDAATILLPEPGLRNIYQGVRQMLNPTLSNDVLVEGLGGDASTGTGEDSSEQVTGKITSRTTALLTRLGATQLTGEQLLKDLEHVLRDRTVLESASAVAFPGSEDKLDAIHAWLASSSWKLQMRVAKLPLFRTRSGQLHRLATDPSDRQGAMVVPEDHDALADFYEQQPAPRRPLVSSKASASQDALLARINPPALGFEILIADLRHAGFIPRDKETLLTLQRLLEQSRKQIAETTRDALATLDIWPDTEGVARSLKGAANERAYLPSPLEVRDFFPNAPFLDESVCAMAHVREMGVEVLGPAAVLAGFSPEAKPPLAAASSPELIRALHALLLGDDVKLGGRSRGLLVTLPLFLDDDGEVRQLSELHDANQTLRSLYHKPPTDGSPRHFISREGSSREVVAAFGLDASLTEATARTLVEDLRAERKAILAGKSIEDLPLIGPHRERVIEYIEASRAQLGSEDLAAFFETPIFLGEDGKLGELGDWSVKLERDKLYQFSEDVMPVMKAAGYRRLSTQTRAKLLKVLEESKNKEMRADGLLINLGELTEVAPNTERQSALQRALALEAIQEWIATRSKKANLPRGTSLDHLMIWETRAGGVTCASRLVTPGLLDELIGKDAIERPELDRVSAKHPERLAACSKLLETRSGADFLLDILESHAEPGKPLRQQRGLLSSAKSLAAALKIAAPSIDPADTLPQINARGRLVKQRLAVASKTTITLVDQLPANEGLMDLDFATELGTELAKKLGKTLEMATILDALRQGEDKVEELGQHPILSEEARRKHFYAWLVEHEREIFSDPGCRELLSHGKLFPTERGSLLPTRNLVLDPSLPDLGVDWRPSSEIPSAVVTLLARHLGLDDAIDLGELCEEHLIPAYKDATRAKDHEAAYKIFSYLSGRTARVGTKEMKRVLAGHTLQVENMSGDFVNGAQIFVMPRDLKEASLQIWGHHQPSPNPKRYHQDDLPLLGIFGVRSMPGLSDVLSMLEGKDISEQTSLGLATLLAKLEDHGVEGITRLDQLRQTPWVLDGTRCLRRPGEVFVDSLNARSLIGDFHEEFALSDVTERLGEDLARRIGFKTTSDVTLEHIKRHLADREARHVAVPPAVYQWLEVSLQKSKITPERLLDELSGLAWVYSDDGQHFEHLDVLGGRHIEMFGNRRGYWSRGLSEFPTLCRTFGIERDPRPEFCHRFLDEIAARVEREGDHVVLEDGALPSMLLANYEFLGRVGTPARAHSTLILCTERGPQALQNERSERWRLLSPGHKLLLRSDTPDLEDLFAEASTFYVAATGAREQQENINRYYQRVGLRLLREAHRVETNASGGEDRTEQHASKIGPLRALFRALSEVAPRIQLKLGSARGKWHIEERLTGLATSAPIRVISSLEVTYVLDGIGRASADSDAVWDTAAGTLLIDTEAISAPTAHATGLALGLMPCIYAGPDQDAVIEVVTLLLTLGDFSKMERHLDRRHYPAVAAARRPIDELSERLGQVLDFEIDGRLIKRFPELRGKSFEPWRDRERIGALLPEDTSSTREAWARTTAPGLLDMLGCEDPSDDLVEALTTVLAAERLGDIPPDLFDAKITEDSASAGDTSWIEDSVEEAPDAEPELPTTDDAPTLPEKPDFPHDGALFPPGGVLSPPPEVQKPRKRETSTQLIEELLAHDPASDTSTTGAPTRQVATYVDVHRNPEQAAQFEQIVEESLPAIRTAPEPQLKPSDYSTWGRFKRWLGFNAGTAPEVEAPSWTQQGSNPLQPEATIQPQLWVTQEMIQQVAKGPLEVALRFEPRELPKPYLYAPMVYGATFDETSQHWLPGGAPPRDWYGEARPLGREVLFHGTIAPGMSQLPLPLYSTPTAAPRIIEGEGAMRAQQRPDGSLWLHLEADHPVKISYSVDLLEPPILTGETSAVEPPDALLIPTVELRDMPPATRRFIETRRNSVMSSWELALATQAFVQTNYIYDDGFMEIPEVAKAKARLRAGEGNHHLEILHASRDGETQGRGICYELNMMVVELLRHLGLPAMVSTCWVLNSGVLANPDHLVALAILPSASGPALLPLDAAVGLAGPIRPMAPTSAASSAEQGSTLPPINPSSGPWNTQSLENMPTQAHVERELATLRQREQAELTNQFAHTRRALVHLLAVTGEPIPNAIASLVGEHAQATDFGLATLHREGAARLGQSGALFSTLVAVIRGDYAAVTVLPPAVRELVKRDLVRVESRSRYHVSIE